ncbi:MAG TPA: phytanoyl-CoA dioxygenase family protein [Blastocatellia bacterium]|nr:phytanoyl-CoA dioxygenase family protein [Blastocatellia bacterium]
MDDWFNRLASDSELTSSVAQELHKVGFIIIQGPVACANLGRLAAAYDASVSGADPSDVSIGSTTTRVHDFVNRGPDFDGLYVYRPILGACCSVIGQPFKLSTMLARTVNPHSPAQALHVDFPRDADGWPMVGFIIMVDEFRSDNGATRFVPGSHKWSTSPAADHARQALACGPAGSMIIYNGSIWHGHSANQTGEPRRSIQGAYIRRDAEPGVNQAARIRQETLGRIGALAKYVLAV